MFCLFVRKTVASETITWVVLRLRGLLQYVREKFALIYYTSFPVRDTIDAFEYIINMYLFKLVSKHNAGLR